METGNGRTVQQMILDRLNRIEDKLDKFTKHMAAASVERENLRGQVTGIRTRLNWVYVLITSIVIALVGAFLDKIL